jgi:hypothetical protein
MNNVGLRVVFSILSVKLNDSSLLIINFFSAIYDSFFEGLNTFWHQNFNPLDCSGK